MQGRTNALKPKRIKYWSFVTSELGGERKNEYLKVY